MSIALDLSALDPEFKQHAHRGIGRYVKELKNYFENYSDLKNQISFFDHRSILGEYGTFLNSICDYLPVFRQTVKQQLILPGFYRQVARQKKTDFSFSRSHGCARQLYASIYSDST